MFRAIIVLLFLGLNLLLAAFVSLLTMKFASLSGLPGYIAGALVFIGILTLSVMILAAINDRINSKQRFEKTRSRMRAGGVNKPKTGER